MRKANRDGFDICRALGLVALVAACIGLCDSHAVAAEKCPIDEAAAAKAGSLPDAIAAAMKTEFSCEGAYRILDLCQLGSSADKALSDIVLSKCEPRFVGKATPAVKDAYAKARIKCSKIAEKREGSLYQSQAAVCLARTGRDFARKYTATQ